MRTLAEFAFNAAISAITRRLKTRLAAFESDRSKMVVKRYGRDSQQRVVGGCHSPLQEKDRESHPPATLFVKT